MKKAFKIVCSLMMAITMIISVLVFTSAEDDDTLSVYVTSDIHYRPPDALTSIEETEYLPDPIFHHANTKGMLTYEADGIIDAFLKKVESSDAKYLLVAGDQSEDGFWEEHRTIAEKLEDFEQRTGKIVFTIPGNHDIRTRDSRDRLNLEDYLEIYKNLGYDMALEKHEGTASYTADLDPGYRLLAIDVCVYRDDKSQLPESLLNWTKAQLEQGKKDGKKMIAMVHYNVLPHFALESVAGSLLCTEDYRSFATLLADAGVKYVLTGHQHANDISSATTKKGNHIFDIETGSLITYPLAYRVINFSNKEVEIKTEYIDKIDTSLLPGGFTAGQLALINNDLKKYSFDYNRAGFQSYAYQLGELTKKLADALKVKEGTEAYKAVEDLIVILGDAIKMPLYDTKGTPAPDSVEELAKQAGIKLDKSEYRDILDLAGALYANHFAGDENLTIDSVDIKLLGQTINAVLVYAFSKLPVQAVNMLLKAAGIKGIELPFYEAALALGSKTINMRTPAKAFTKELVRSLGDGIFTDFSAPGDLNVTLEPYGSSWEINGYQPKTDTFSYALQIIWRVVKTCFNGMLRLIGLTMFT